MWTWLKDATFWCIQSVYNFCGDWGLAIIIITIIFRVLIYPITEKQLKSSYSMQKIQPYIKEIQTKYAGDQQRMNEEMQKIYAEHNFNPLAGCLPMLLQMPIFIILYQTLREYIPSQGASFYGLIPNLAAALSTTWASGIIASIPYIIIVLLFGVSTLIPMLMQENAEKQTKIMAIFMAFFMIYIGWSAPAGVMLYWVASSFFGIAQQKITTSVLKAKDKKEAPVIEVKPVSVDVERKIKKAKPTKKDK